MNINTIYKKGRIIRATYLIDDGSEIGRIITSNLIVIQDVFETDQDIMCIDSDNPKNILVIPNIRENILELPTSVDETPLNFIVNQIINKADPYIYY